MSKTQDIANNWLRDMKYNYEEVYGHKWGGDQILKELNLYLGGGQIYGNVYEIGCGGGRLTKKLFEWGADSVTASDVHSLALNRTKQHEPRAKVVLTDGESIRGNGYDIIFSWGVLLHLPQYLVQHYFDLAQSAGDKLIFALPSFETPKGIDSYITFIKNKTWRNPYFTGYYNHYTEEQVHSMLAVSGWVVDSVERVMDRDIMYICAKTGK